MTKNAYDVERTRMVCGKHGEQKSAALYADVSFCSVCIRDLLLEHGLKPIYTEIHRVRLEEK